MMHPAFERDYTLQPSGPPPGNFQRTHAAQAVARDKPSADSNMTHDGEHIIRVLLNRSARRRRWRPAAPLPARLNHDQLHLGRDLIEKLALVKLSAIAVGFRHQYQRRPR